MQFKRDGDAQIRGDVDKPDTPAPQRTLPLEKGLRRANFPSTTKRTMDSTKRRQGLEK